ncbi:hypothetical protein WJX81_006495 [Elliptochloris bilobata]|uniref:SH2 domain-containing protein n=1 Tax=Elliptochloris bilobata TaxID=381761 RepID=A0AAW1QYF7_9CHLO
MDAATPLGKRRAASASRLGVPYSEALPGGRPPLAPPAVASPFDLALGPVGHAGAAAMSGMPFRPAAHGSASFGGLPFAAARSLERSLESAGAAASGSMGGSLAKASSLPEAAEELSGVAQPEVDKQQVHYVRYACLSEAHEAPSWRQVDSLTAQTQAYGEAPHTQSGSGAVSLSLRIVQAPAAFALPMVQRKVFKPPFTVRLEVRHRGPLTLAVCLEAHPLNETAHAQIATWTPDADKAAIEVEGARIARQLQAPAMFGTAGSLGGMGLAEGGGGGEPEQVHLEDFKFAELKWAKSSRMSKRWLVFTCRIQEDAVYLLYALPTVVISRRTDQYGKAHETLMGGGTAAGKRVRVSFAPSASLPPGPLPGRSPDVNALALAASVPVDAGMVDGAGAGRTGAVLDGGYVRLWIAHRYCAAGFTRVLADADMAALLRLAGVQATPGAAQSLVVDSAKWAAFRDWFAKGLRTLKQCTRAWDASAPAWVAGFAVSRGVAEALLAERPAGTFVIRLCSEPGAFAISCRVGADADGGEGAGGGHGGSGGGGGGGFVDHLLVDAVDLVSQPLEAWVLAHAAATHLLDPATSQLLPKEALFRQARPPPAPAGRAALRAPTPLPLPRADPDPTGALSRNPNMGLSDVLMLASLGVSGGGALGPGRPADPPGFGAAAGHGGFIGQGEPTSYAAMLGSGSLGSLRSLPAMNSNSEPSLGFDDVQVEELDLLPGLFSGIGDLGATPRAGDAAAHAFGGAARGGFGGGGGAGDEQAGGARARPNADFEFCQIFRPRGDLGQT